MRLVKIASPMLRSNNRQGFIKYGAGSLLRHVIGDDDTARIVRKVFNSRERPKITATAKGIATAGAGPQPPRLLQLLRLSDPRPPGAFCCKYTSLRATHKKSSHGPLKYSCLRLGLKPSIHPGFN